MELLHGIGIAATHGDLLSPFARRDRARRQRGRSAADTLARLIAVTGSAAGVVYFVLPTSASGIAQGTTLFEVNLRYATPALALGTVLVPIILSISLGSAGLATRELPGTAQA